MKKSLIILMLILLPTLAWSKKAINISNPDNYNAYNLPVFFNATNLTISSGNGFNEVRIGLCPNEKVSSPCTDIEIASTVINTDNSTWAYIEFPANVTAGSWLAGNVWYANASATAPNYANKVKLVLNGGNIQFDLIGTGVQGGFINSQGNIVNYTFGGYDYTGTSEGLCAGYSPSAWIFGDGSAGSTCTIKYNGPTYSEINCTNSASVSTYEFYAYRPDIQNTMTIYGLWMHYNTWGLYSYIPSASYITNTTSSILIPGYGTSADMGQQNIVKGKGLYNTTNNFMIGEVWNYSSLSNLASSSLGSDQPMRMEIGRNSTTFPSIPSGNSVKMRFGEIVGTPSTSLLSNFSNEFMTPPTVAYFTNTGYSNSGTVSIIAPANQTIYYASNVTVTIIPVSAYNSTISCNITWNSNNTVASTLNTLNNTANSTVIMMPYKQNSINATCNDLGGTFSTLITYTLKKIDINIAGDIHAQTIYLNESIIANHYYLPNGTNLLGYDYLPDLDIARHIVATTATALQPSVFILPSFLYTGDRIDLYKVISFQLGSIKEASDILINLQDTINYMSAQTDQLKYRLNNDESSINTLINLNLVNNTQGYPSEISALQNQVSSMNSTITLLCKKNNLTGCPSGSVS